MHCTIKNFMKGWKKFMAKPLVLIVGKSGSGKTYLSKFLEHNYGMKMLNRYTTRPPRINEKDGHIFISYEDYVMLQNKVATTYYHGNYYCATKEQCEESDIYVIDPSGLKSFRNHYNGEKQIKVVYLKVGWIIRLYRMIKRGDGVCNTLKRIIYDYKEFSGVEAQSDIYIMKRNTAAKMAAEIFYKVMR